MSARLAETRGSGFELLRHFLRRSFDSDLVTEPGQWAGVLIGCFSLLLTMFMVMAPSLHEKYAILSKTAAPDLYGHILRADQLWLITLGMSAVGLLAAAKWHSLFPGVRDYLALGGLPVRPHQIFVAKLLSLLLIVSGALATMNIIPAIGFPALSGAAGRFHTSLASNVAAHATACALAGYFFFFALIGTQGLLLNLLRPRWFRRITGFLQAALIAAMLVLIVLSFSIDHRVERFVTARAAAGWLPPVWFLGLYQAMSGNPDPWFQELARRAAAAFGIALGAALLSYLISYHRHRRLMVEGVRPPGSNAKLGLAALDRVVPEAREQAVVVFMAKTLARSGQHRIVLMGYIGFAAAVALSGILGVIGMVPPERKAAACFVYAHAVFAMFLFIGLRHLFSVPIELRANWIFQLTERDSRGAWLDAVDKFSVGGAALLFVILPFPLEIALAGWHAVLEVALCSAAGLLAYELVFLDWEKVPFTCSYLPGKQPAWVRVLQLLALLASLPVLTAILTLCCYSLHGFVIVMTLIVAALARVRRAREVAWAGVRLTFEDKPEPAVRSLSLSA